MSNVRFSPEQLQSRAKTQGLTISDQVMGFHKKNPQFGGMIGIVDMLFMKRSWTDTSPGGKTHPVGTSFYDTMLNKVKEKDPKAYTTLTGITPQQKVSQLTQPKPRQTFGEPTITRRSLLG